jgi:hypothetical protein
MKRGYNVLLKVIPLQAQLLCGHSGPKFV